MVNHYSNFKSIRTNFGDNYSLFYNIYTPKDGDILGTVLILHGMKEHSGRYEEVAAFLAENKFAVLTYDHIAHGKSVAKNEKHGHFSVKNASNQLVKDADAMADFLHQKYPDVPHFVLGHSMGSFVARLLLQQSNHKFKGAVIVGTGGKNVAAQFSKPIFYLLSKIAPKSNADFINNTFDKMNNAAFKNEPGATSTSWLSVSKENRKSFENAPLCGLPFSNYAFYTLIRLNTKTTSRNWAQNIPTDFPMLFVSGAEDPIGNFGKGVELTISNLKKDGFKNVEMQLYANMRHEILNEDIKEEVFHDILRWLVGANS